LKAKFIEGKKGKNGIEIKIQKLFSKHISVEEHQSILSAKPGEGKGPNKFINIYVGVPNRVKKLVELGAIKVASSKFKHIVIDSHLNAKNFSIFDIYETRDDLYDLFMLARKRLLKRKLKISIV